MPEVVTLSTPAPRAMMANAAPKAAPCDTPTVEAEAIGLRSTLCITQPTMASPKPATMAVQTRGPRRLKTMTFSCVLPPPASVRSTAPMGMPEEPQTMAASAMNSVRHSSSIKNSTFRCIYCP